MTPEAREGLNAYYHESGSWADDRTSALTRSRTIAWIVAAVAISVAALEAFAIIALTPLKTVVPYTLLVDRTTGYVQQLKPIEASKIAPDAALTQSFLVQYVVAREEFDADTVQANYRKVGLWSADNARTQYLNGMQASNPESPLARLPRSAIVETVVKSVSPLSGRTALVRFDTVRRDQGVQRQPARSWVAVIRYRFSGQPMSVADRYLNPLGFQVLRYRKDEEALPSLALTESPAAQTPQSLRPGPLPVQTGSTR